MSRRPVRSLMLLVVTLVVTVTACAGPAPAPPDTKAITTGGERFSIADTETAALGSDAEPGVFPRTVRHARGETVLDAAPQRVVVLDTGELDDVLSLGLTPVGVATTDGQIPAYLEPKLGDATRLGLLDPLNLEGIASLRPDLIVGSRLRVDRYYDQLAAIAPTVLSIRPGFPWKENLRLIGDALGAETAATELLNAYQTRAEGIRASVGPDAPTISLVRFMPGRLRLYGNLSFIGVILADIGLPRPPEQDIQELAVEISEERIDQADAGQVFYSSFGDPARNGRDAVVGGELWARLPAVAAGNVAEVEDSVWFLGLGPTGANLVLDDLAAYFADR